MLNNKKPKLLICTTTQFGYLTDTYKYCEYLRELYDITYVCWDYKQSKIELEKVSVHYIDRTGDLLSRNFRLLNGIYKIIQKGTYHKIFIVYVRGISLLKLFLPNIQFFLDIRTASVNKSWLNRNLFNIFLRIETLFFKNISIISEGVAQSLKIKGYSILPLGGENFKINHCEDSKITFIYVGTLQYRNILTFVKAFHQFTCQWYQHQEIVLRIIGDSPDGELQEIQKYVETNEIKNIEIKGRINQKDLPLYFKDVDIGISYIPITPWFEFQPPSKTYEYLVSGLPVLATETFENRKIISNKNGVLIKDDIESVVDGLKLICQNFNEGLYDIKEIQKDNLQFSWEYIVLNKFQQHVNRR